MNKLAKKIVTTAGAVGLLLNSALPVFAATSFTITGNGTDSTNRVLLDVVQDSLVVQTNDATITNDIDVVSNTGSNDANANTGGSVSIDTGDADVDTGIINFANTNTANVGCCGLGDAEVIIGGDEAGNGAGSNNLVDLDLGITTSFFQDNLANVTNTTNVDADSGRNRANENTGGAVSVTTGDVDVESDAQTSVNGNSATMVGSGDGEGGSLSARILGNGSESTNRIALDSTRSVIVGQAPGLDEVGGNEANVTNTTNVDADSGRNNANANTGGDVMVGTGAANADILFDTAVNFNIADVDCGCLLEDITGEISDNGSLSTNVIAATLGNTDSAFQDNLSTLDNDANVDTDTGLNDANDNTDTNVDVLTGSSNNDVEVINSGNVNTYGEGAGLASLGFTFDVGALLGIFGF